MGVIYTIINTINKKQYIGSAKNFRTRKRIHINSLNKKKHHSRILQRAWNKYGGNSFIFVIVEDNIDNKNLIEREQWWLDNENCEYNICKIAGSSLGVKRTAKTIKKMSDATSGVKHPLWRRILKSMSQGGERHHNYGKKLSDKTIEKKSKTMLKKYKDGYISPNNKEIDQYTIDGEFIATYKSVIEAAGFNQKKRKCITQCLIGNNKTAYGFVWRYKSEMFSYVKNPRIKKIIQYDLNGQKINEFSSIKDASKLTNCNQTGIWLCCHKKRNKSGKWVWRFENDEFSYVPKRKKIIQYDLSGKKINEFSSAVEASEVTKGSKCGIFKCCYKKINQSGGYVWRFKGDKFSYKPKRITKLTPFPQFKVST